MRRLERELESELLLLLRAEEAEDLLLKELEERWELREGPLLFHLVVGDVSAQESRWWGLRGWLIVGLGRCFYECK